MYKKFVILASLFFGIVSFSSASVVREGSIPTTATCGVGSFSTTYTVASNSNLLVVPTVFTGAISGLMYDGVPLVLAYADISFGAYANTYYLYNPSVGAHTLAATVTGGTACLGIGAADYSGVDTTKPVYGGYVGTPSAVATSSLNYVASSTYPNTFVVWTLSAMAGASISSGNTGTNIVSQPEVAFAGTAMADTDVFTGSYNMVVNSAGQLYRSTWAQFVASSGGGGGGSSTSSLDSIIYTPASLFSQYGFGVTTSSTTVNFTSSVASSSLRQNGLVFVTHASTSVPMVTWGGSTMTRYRDTATSTSGYITSMYTLRHPSSVASVVISSVGSGTQLFILESVWSNADIYTNSDIYNVQDGAYRANIDIPNTVSTPFTEVASFFTTDIFSTYGRLPTSVLNITATSSLGTNTLVSSLCTDFYSCPTGYKNNSFIPSFRRDGVLVGIGMYATSSLTYASTTVDMLYASLPTVMGNFGTPDGFRDCLDDGFTGSITCLAKNMVFWVMYLFIPAPDSYVKIKEMLMVNMTSTSSLLSSLVSLPLQFTLWTSTSSYPSADAITLEIPHFKDSGHYTASFQGTSTPFFARIDNAMANFVTTWFPLLIALWIGWIGFRIFYS